jgi:DNA polymerase elongation subunit (family B)
MIQLWDYQSLYPSLMIGCNLHSPSEKGWNGSGVLPNICLNDEDGVKGTYDIEPGRIEKVIRWLYQQRIEIPKSDKRNLAYKIVLNTLYGLLGNQKFKSLFNITAASDCTSLARRCIKHARTVLQNYNVECIYGDTDSIFIKFPDEQTDNIKVIIDEINKTQRESMPVYFEYHGLKHECNIKRIYFFRDDKGEFLAKHYIYVKDNEDITTKGLQVIKGNASPLSKKIYDEIIDPLIKSGQDIIRDYDYWKDIYQEYAANYPELLVKRYRVWPLSTYENTTSIQAQISKRYGSGEHWLIINSRIGAGKGNRYAKVEELKEKLGDDWKKTIKVNEYMKDIREFINWKQRGKLKK